MPKTPQEALRDPRFLALPETDQRSILGNLDRRFAALSYKDQVGVLQGARRQFDTMKALGADQTGIPGVPLQGAAITEQPGGTLDVAKEMALQNAVKTAGGASMTDVYDSASEGALQILESALGTPRAKLRQDFGPLIPFLNQMGRHAAGAVDFAMSPVGVGMSALGAPAAALVRPYVAPAAGAAFTMDLGAQASPVDLSKAVPGLPVNVAWQNFQQNPGPETAADLIATGVFATLPMMHAAGKMSEADRLLQQAEAAQRQGTGRASAGPVVEEGALARTPKQRQAPQPASDQVIDAQFTDVPMPEPDTTVRRGARAQEVPGATVESRALPPPSLAAGKQSGKPIPPQGPIPQGPASLRALPPARGNRPASMEPTRQFDSTGGPGPERVFEMPEAQTTKALVPYKGREEVVQPRGTGAGVPPAPAPEPQPNILQQKRAEVKAQEAARKERLTGAKMLKPAKDAQPQTVSTFAENERLQEKPDTPASKVVEMRPAEISVDPVRFQFKQQGIGQKGVTDEFKDVKRWDPEKAGVISVWRDPVDGKTYVINGHHRVEMANRLGAESVTARYIDAPDAKTARMKGALINIAEGRGESLDAAKVFRDSGMTPEQLEEDGVSLRGKVAREGLALSNLAQPIFDDVVTGVFPVRRAAIIGENVKGKADQQAVYDMVRKSAKMTDEQLSEAIRLTNAAPRMTETQDSLFGSWTDERSLIAEKAEVSSYIRKELQADKKLFGAVATDSAAARLAETGNKIEAAKNADVATIATQAQALYDKLSTFSGPISAALDKAAERIANGEPSARVKQEAYQAIRGELRGQLGKFSQPAGDMPAGSGRTEVVGEGRSRDAGAGELRQEPAQVKGETGSLLGKFADEAAQQGQKQYEEKLLGEQLTAQIKSGTAARPSNLKPAENRDLFDDGKPESGSLFEGGSFQTNSLLGALDEPVTRFWEKQVRPVVKDLWDATVVPMGRRIALEGGGQGRQLWNMIQKARDEGEVLAGTLIRRLVDSGLQQLSRDERFNLLDALEGKATPMNERVRKAFVTARGITDEMADVAMSLGVQVRTSGGKREFVALEDYFPHTFRQADALRMGPVRRDIIDNLVRRGIRPDKEAAGKFLDSWIRALDSGKFQDDLLDHLVKTGQAVDAADALAKLKRMRSHVKRHGSLEYSREVNLPFYDPDPARVLPHSAASSAIRLAQIAEFGQEHERIKREVLKIADAGGDADFVQQSVDRIVGVIQEGDTTAARASRFLRSVQTLKLGLAAIPNSTQGFLNSLLVSDLPSAAYGMRMLFTKEGRKFGIESGAAIEPVLAEAVRELGSNQFVDKYLRVTGFNTTESWNRVLSANAGAKYAHRLFNRLRLDPKNRVYRERLEMLGIDAEVALRRKALTAADTLKAAKRMSDITNFRARAEEMPAWMSSTWGKVIGQFKNYIYQQTRLVLRETVGELQSGRVGRATRNALILATVFPFVGDLVRSLRDLITGKERKWESFLDRYAEGVAQVGAFGVVNDLMNAGRFQRVAEWLGGPTAATVAGGAEAALSKNPGERLKKFGLQQAPLGSLLQNRVKVAEKPRAVAF